LSETKRVELDHPVGRGPLARFALFCRLSKGKQADSPAVDVDVDLPAGRCDPIEMNTEFAGQAALGDNNAADGWIGRLAGGDEVVEQLVQPGTVAALLGFGERFQIGHDTAEAELMGLLFGPHRDAGARLSGSAVDQDAGVSLAMGLDVPLCPGHRFTPHEKRDMRQG
jgi:hypothetical protein